MLFVGKVMVVFVVAYFDTFGFELSLELVDAFVRGLQLGKKLSVLGTQRVAARLQLDIFDRLFARRLLRSGELLTHRCGLHQAALGRHLGTLDLDAQLFALVAESHALLLGRVGHVQLAEAFAQAADQLVLLLGVGRRLLEIGAQLEQLELGLAQIGRFEHDLFITYKNRQKYFILFCFARNLDIKKKNLFAQNV